MAFKKAERFLTNPTIALTGPTGSGKTFSALRLATGIAKAMGKRFALIDTENGSASLYSEEFDFDALNITPPFTHDKYIAAIQEAEKAGYCCLVIDSLTHAWAGEGGLTAQKDQLDARPGSNHWTNWGPIKKKDLELRNAYLHSSIPFLIATMRSKMEYAQSENAGKKKVEKKGLAPVQSPDVEYEFSIQFDVAMNHEAEVSKDRSGIFAKNPILTVTEETGQQLVAWRNSGKAKPVPPPPAVQQHPPVEPQTSPPIDDQGFPEDELDRALGNDPMTRDQAGDYQIQFGKYTGKTIRSMEPGLLKNYCEWLEGQAREKNQQIDPFGPVGWLLANAKIFRGE